MSQNGDRASFKEDCISHMEHLHPLRLCHCNRFLVLGHVHVVGFSSSIPSELLHSFYNYKMFLKHLTLKGNIRLLSLCYAVQV